MSDFRPLTSDLRSLTSALSPHTFLFVVDAAHHGLRIDTFLASRLRNHSTARLLRLAAAGLVTVNDVPCPVDRRVHRGEEVTVRLAEPPEPFYPPESIPLQVLYDDSWLIAVNKAAGMIMHPVGPVGDGTLANAVQAILDGQTRQPGLLRPGIVHRLDRETSGVVLIAKDAVAHASLTKQFERSAIRKTYVALTEGLLESDSGLIDRPIGQQPGSLRMTAADDAASSRSAATEYRVLERFRTTTLVEARPRTGRKHQIRVHLASIGHPVCGDAYYGSANEPSRHALHAAAIAFHHPVSNAPLRIIAPAPADFWRVLHK